MKPWLVKLLAFVPAGIVLSALAFAIWQAAGFAATRSARQHEKCEKLRVEFFDACLAVEPRYRCEVQWAQLGGKVFDVRPNATWADQVDCSGEFE